MAVDPIDPLNAELRVLREIQAPQQVQEAPDRPGGYRVSSAAFSPGKDGTVSVDLEESLQRAGLPINGRFPAMARAVGAVAHTVGTIRAHKLLVVHDPIDGNDHHGEIRPSATSLSKRERREIARELADTCEIVIPMNAEAIAAYKAQYDC